MLYRSNKTPTFILIGLLVVIGILSFNYWSLSDQKNELRRQLIELDEKYSQLTMQKNALDKEKETCESRVKFYEDRVESNQQLMDKKDSDLNDISKKLKDLQVELETVKTSNDDLTQKLKTCNEEKASGDSVKAVEQEKHAKEIDEFKKTIGDLELKLKQSSAINQSSATNCDDLVKLERTNVVKTLLTVFTDVDSQTKLRNALNLDEKTTDSSSSTIETSKLVVNSNETIQVNASNNQIPNRFQQLINSNSNESLSLTTTTATPTLAQQIKVRDVDDQESQIKSPNENQNDNNNNNNENKSKERILDGNNPVIEEPHIAEAAAIDEPVVMKHQADNKEQDEQNDNNP